jgi:gas vesicle protein
MGSGRSGDGKMENAFPDNSDGKNIKGIFFGALIGGLAGVAALLLLAAQTGTQARSGIRRTSMQWLDRAADIAKPSPEHGRNAAGGRTAGNMTVHVS